MKCLSVHTRKHRPRANPDSLGGIRPFNGNGQSGMAAG